MKMTTIRSRKGSLSIFISIMMSSVIFLMSVLLHITVLAGREMIVRSALIQQQDLLLSHYSEILEDRYGLFAFSNGRKYEEAFYRMTGDVAGIEDLRVAGNEELTGEVLYNNILQFSKPRFPVQAAAQLIDRMNLFQSGFAQAGSAVSGTDPIVPSAGDNGIAADTGSEAMDVGFGQILSLLSGLKLDQINSQGKKLPGNLGKPLEEISKLLRSYKCENEFDNEFSKAIKSDLSITDTTLNSMSDFAEKFYSVETGGFYDRMAFEFYTGQMFSCKVNSFSSDGSRRFRTDMRGRSFSDLSPSGEPEIEAMIFGFEESGRNVFFTKLAIEGIRFVSNLVANLSDSSKRAEIKSLAAGICILIAAASSGTVAIPPEAAEAVVLVIQSAVQAASDYSSLINGESVALLPMEGFSGTEIYYADYLRIMLLAVPKNVKLSRMESIIQKNTFGFDAVFYTGISVSCRYRGKRYFCEGGYFGRVD